MGMLCHKHRPCRHTVCVSTSLQRPHENTTDVTHAWHTTHTKPCRWSALPLSTAPADVYVATVKLPAMTPA